MSCKNTNFIDKKICVVGCGGTGHELIKILINYTKNITIIDSDKIEITNLNRQFWFSKETCSMPKAEVIGKKLNIEYKVAFIQNFKSDFLNKFKIVFLCVDNIKTRMDVNLMFIQSKCNLLVDLGVEGYACHIKKVENNSTSCLYCIKDIYKIENTEPLCSLSFFKQINLENRTKALKSLIFELQNEYDEFIVDSKITEIFNSKVNKMDLRTNEKEVYELRNTIVPSIACVNAICACLAVKIITDESNDFYFYDGSKTIYLAKEKIKKDDNCIVCKSFENI
ncbi:ECR1 [Ecytonucleospora hepatopenaei]|uniref:NEDD8-activating enzyme E1 catalytic subunit n=1 Tax=Ecytonucleospora hepatopenaei TaxID=646526 RepID=A0A1W0E5U2_9MICR|nr:ECR1 [Ecytonucleospora hepatopenaei]